MEVLSFYAPKPGPALLFFGALHGNERCGTQAIRQIIAALQSGKLLLERGSATFVPIANPVAYEKNLRYVEENLNRIFKPTQKPRSLEAQFANRLCHLVDQCDALLDIHSTTAKGQPFIYLDFPTRRNHALAKILGPKLAVTGWPQLYAKFGKAHQSFDTPTYAAGQGKDCVLIECGQHQELAAIKVAYTAILNTLRHYGLIKGPARPQHVAEIRIYAGFFRQHAGDQLAKEWRHLDRVRKGDALIYHANGTTMRAGRDSYIVMPKSTAPVGDDWLYLGQAT